jgi:hypothetical protein
MRKCQREELNFVFSAAKNFCFGVDAEIFAGVKDQ